MDCQQPGEVVYNTLYDFLYISSFFSHYIYHSPAQPIIYIYIYTAVDVYSKVVQPTYIVYIPIVVYTIYIYPSRTYQLLLRCIPVFYTVYLYNIPKALPTQQ